MTRPILVTLLATLTINAADVSQPIAHWNLDDAGAVAKDSAGNHHGKIVGATPAPGKVGGALDFVRKQGQHVEIPYSKDFAISTFTVSAWVYLTKEPTFSGILGTRHHGDHTFDLLDIQANARIDALNLTVKAGASNVLENLHIETYGGPTVGRLAYLSLLFEVDTRN